MKIDLNNNELLVRSTFNLNQVLGTDPSQPDNLPLTFSPYYNHELLIKHLSHKNSSFIVLSLNCQSLNAKIDELTILLSQLNDHNIELDAICLQETWYKDTQIPPAAQLKGYTAISKPKHCSEHSGLLIYLKDTYAFQKIDTPQSNVFDSLFIKVLHQEENIILGNIYRPPHKIISQLEAFNENFTSLLQTFSKYKIAILGGDYNINLLDLKSSKATHAHEFYNNVITNGFIPKITLPTRLGETSYTLIDNFMCKIPNKLTSTSGILSHKLSDHQPYFITIDLKTNSQKNTKQSRVTTRKINQNALNAIREDITNSLESIDYSENADPNTNYNNFISCLQTSLNNNCPIKTVKYNKHKHKASPWITNGIIKSIRARDKIYVKLKHTNAMTPEAEVLKLSLQLFNRILQKTIRQAKYEYYHSTFEALKTNMKKTWGLINGILNRKSKNRSYPEEFLINNTTVSDKTQIANEFNSFFTNIGKNLASKISHVGPETYMDYLTQNITSNLAFNQVTNSEVESAIKKLKSTSSQGNDTLTSKLIKLLSPHIIPPITTIVNQSITTGIFPDALKIAKVIPIYKKDGEKQLENYRPISILPTISKIFERILFNQIHDYFRQNNLFYKGQYGFRPKHSTELAALELVDRLTQDIDKNAIPLNIFLDLSKAFDTIDHKILLDKLKHYGFSDLSLKLLCSYLTNRKQFVSLDNTESNLLNIHTGIPQGSILGPLLFIIYINDLPQSCSSFVPIIYADDTTLYTKINETNAELSINQELEHINIWLRVNKLSLNAKKTKFMIFHKKNKKFKVPSLTINQVPLNRNESFNFLGLKINEHLTWTEHIKHISLRISRCIGQLNTLKDFLPSKILLTLYNTTILPHLNYCILIWGSQHHLIYTLQKKCIRIISNSKYNSHSEPIYKRNKLLKIEDIYKLQQLNFYHKLKNNTLPSYFNTFSTTTNHEIHQHNTRRTYLFPIRADHTFAKNFLRYSLTDLVNSTPPIIIDKVHTHSYHGFSIYVKTHFINKYNMTCNLQACYICNRD